MSLRNLGYGLMLLLFSMASQAASYEVGVQWRSLHGEHFVVHFPVGAEPLAQKTLAIAEKVHQRLAPIFDWVPRQATNIVLTDTSDLANGYATPFPNNHLTLFTTAPHKVQDHGRWMELLITHEYTHTLHLDRAAGLPLALRNLFGRNSLLFPNVFQPTWGIEGLATYFETSVEQGSGRGQSSYFDMLMRMDVAGGGVKPLRQINQPLASWPSGTVPYLYGVKFFNYMAERYGDEGILALLMGYSDNIVPFRLNSNAKLALGASLETVYRDFVAQTTAKQQAKLASIRAQGVVAGEALSHSAYATDLPVLAQDGRLFYIARDGLEQGQLRVLDTLTASNQSLGDVNLVAAMDWHDKAGLVMSQLQLCDSLYPYFDLYHVDATTAKRRRLTECGRYRDLAWSPTGQQLAVIKNRLGNHSLLLLSPEGEELETLWQGHAGEIVIGLDWSPKGGELVASVWREANGWNLEIFDLTLKQWRAITNSPALEQDPHYSADGEHLYFSADYEGVNNVQRMDLASAEVVRLSNVLGGAFRPVVSADGMSLYYQGQHPGGQDIYRLDMPHSVPMTLQPGPSVLLQPLPDLVDTTRLTPYSVWPSLLPQAWMPYSYESNDRGEFGAYVSGRDALKHHQYLALLGYDYTNDQAFGSLDYIYNRWRPMLRLNMERSHALYRFGDELIRIRRSDVMLLGLEYPWFWLETRVAAHIAMFQQVDSSVWRRSDVVPVGAITDGGLGLGLSYDATTRAPLASSRVGRNIQLAVEFHELFGGRYKGEVISLDWREFVRIPYVRGQRLGLRAVLGWGTSEPRPFELGGQLGAAGNSLMPGDTAATLYSLPINRRVYALRGYPEGLAVLRGQRMALISGEWRFPLGLIERGWMAPPAGLHQLSGALFVDSGMAWTGQETKDWSTGLGLELIADLRVFYSYGLRLRMGLAKGLDEGGENQVYLRLGSSF